MAYFMNFTLNRFGDSILCLNVLCIPSVQRLGQRRPELRQFILFGGYNQYSDHKYCDMVYVLDLDLKKPKWVKKCKMPERACYFG